MQDHSLWVKCAENILAILWVSFFLEDGDMSRSCRRPLGRTVEGLPCSQGKITQSRHKVVTAGWRRLDAEITRLLLKLAISEDSNVVCA